MLVGCIVIGVPMAFAIRVSDDVVPGILDDNAADAHAPRPGRHVAPVLAVPRFVFLGHLWLKKQPAPIAQRLGRSRGAPASHQRVPRAA